MKEGIEFIYDTFLNRVAQGRDMPVSIVDSLAQGRVWTGIQAQKNGLIDELGSLQDAITYAANKVNLSTYNVKEFPKYEMDFKSILGGSLMKTLLSESSITKKTVNQINQLESILTLEGIQTRVPFELLIE